MHRMYIIGLAALCAVASGCSQRISDQGLPIGRWDGTGNYLAATWIPHPDDPAEVDTFSASSHNTYDTMLSIRPAPEYGDDSLRMEILSRRGEIRTADDGQALIDGDRTHLVMYLQPTMSIHDDEESTQGVDFYEVVEAGASYDSSDVDISPPDELMFVTCCRKGSTCIVQIQYDDRWSDQLIFHGKSLLKMGMFSTDQMLIHWMEKLSQSVSH